MVRTGRRLWHLHPGVSNDLTLGERAADHLKHWFGTWTALFSVGVIIALWVALQKTSIHWDLYPFILLNLCLSCLAAIQGIILQISANRQDRINAEAARHDQTVMKTLHEQSCTMLELQQQQMGLLAGIEHANAELNLIRHAVSSKHNPKEGTDPAPDQHGKKKKGTKGH